MYICPRYCSQYLKRWPLLSLTIVYVCVVHRESSVTDCTVCPENLNIFDEIDLISIKSLLCTCKSLVFHHFVLIKSFFHVVHQQEL